MKIRHFSFKKCKHLGQVPLLFNLRNGNIAVNIRCYPAFNTLLKHFAQYVPTG
jgi:hypothetical protein